MTATRARVDPALLRLPQPMHLFRLLTRSAHFHLGLGGGADRESLARSLELLSLEVIEPLPRGRPVLDVGCGLGGTTELLARRGCPTLGIDPCAPAIEDARRRLAGRPEVELRVASLQDLMAEGERRFAAMVMLEISPFLRDAAEVFAAVDRLLEPQGLYVFADVVAVPELPRDRVPFFRQGELLRAARRRGDEIVTHSRPGPEIAAHLHQLEQLLVRERSAILHLLEPGRAAVREELDELRRQCEVLHRGFRDGDLGYEILCGRRRSEEGTP